MDARELPPVDGTPRAGGRTGGRRALGSLPALLVSVGVLAPLGLAWLPGGLGVPASASDVGAIAWGPLAASLAVGASAGVLAVIVGAALAAAFEMTDLPGRALWATAALLPFVCPSTVWALGQVYCFAGGGLMERWCPQPWRTLCVLSDPRHYVATTLVLAQVHAPLAMLIIGRGLRRLEHAGLQAAELSLSGWARIGWTAGAVRQEVAAAFLLVLALSLCNFGVPHVLQCPLYCNEIYVRVANYLDHAGVLRRVLPLLAVAVGAAAAIAWAERKRGYVLPDAAPQAAPIRLPGTGLLLVGFAVGYLALTSLLPIVAMIAECKSPGLFVQVAADAAAEAENTIWIGLGAALTACLAGVVVGGWVGRCRRLGVDAVTIAPLGIPALILGLAYLQFFNRLGPSGWVLLGSVPLVLAMAARGWPFATRLVATGRRRVAAEWDEAAQLAGRGLAARWRWIDGPLIADYAAAGLVVAFVLAVGDVEITQLLCPPGSGTLAMRLFTFLHFGPTHVAAGLALMLLTLAAAPVMVYFLVTDRCLRIF